MIGFISGWITHSHLITLTYSAIADLHHLQHTVAQALGLPVSTSRLLAMALNIGIISLTIFKCYT
jgi:ABC-type Fe3+-siderophore transport system permease subunit